MKTMRNKVFETNSSSTHSISVPKNVDIPNKEMCLNIGFGEFGWEWEKYDTIIDILTYLHTAICELYKKDYKKYTDKIDRVLKDNTNIIVNWVIPDFEGDEDYYYLNYGYIDHVEELEGWLDDILNDDDLLLRTIFGATIKTGNDNDDLEDHHKGNNDCQYEYFKGN